MAVLAKLPPAPPEADPRWGIPRAPRRRYPRKSRRKPWPEQPRYHVKTAPVAVRIPEPTRRMLEWLTLATGMPCLSDYIRHVIDRHLAQLGIPLEPGITAQLPPPEIDGTGWRDATPDR